MCLRKHANEVKATKNRVIKREADEEICTHSSSHIWVAVIWHRINGHIGRNKRKLINRGWTGFPSRSILCFYGFFMMPETAWKLIWYHSVIINV